MTTRTHKIHLTTAPAGIERETECGRDNGQIYRVKPTDIYLFSKMGSIIDANFCGKCVASIRRFN